MKIERKKSFEPVFITLETMKELKTLIEVLDVCSLSRRECLNPEYLSTDDILVLSDKLRMRLIEIESKAYDNGSY